MIPPRDSTRHLYGFRISARIKGFLERLRGRNTCIKWELVKADGTLLTWLHKHTNPMHLLPFYQTWPDAKVAWAAYSWEVAE